MKTFKTNIAILIFLFLTLFINSCEDKEPEIAVSVKAISGLQVSDVSNSGNASDIQVSFQKAENESQISEYRLMVVSTEYDGVLDVVKGSSLSNDLYESIASTGSDITFNLSPESKTIEGEELLEDQFYIIFIMSVSNGIETNTNRLSAPSTSFRITNRSDKARDPFLMDAGNNQNASDFQLSFLQASDEDRVFSYRVLLVKSEKAEDYSIEQAESLSVRQYVEVSADGTDKIVNFPANFLDTDRNPIRENQPYKSIVLSVEDGTNALRKELSRASNELALENISFVRTISGEFQGTGGLTYHPNGYLVSGNTSGFFNADNGNGTYKIELDGSITHQTLSLQGCKGNDYHPQKGVIFQVTNNGIFTIFDTGASLPFAGTDNITDVTVAQDGSFFVSTCEPPKVFHYTHNPIFGGYFPLEIGFENNSNAINCLRYIDLDNNGFPIILNFNDNRLYKILQASLADPPSVFAELSFGEKFVSMVYVSPRNAVYATTSQNRIIKIDELKGEISHVAGQGVPKIVDGALESSSFIRPVNITVSSDGNTLYVLDEVNNAQGIVIARKIELVD